MQASDFNPWLETAVADVLESMCFSSTGGDADNESMLDLQQWICGTLQFRGVPNGTFGIGLPPQTALTLAANFLGEDEPDIDPAQTTESVCELANMMCGALLAHLEPKRTFNLSSPVPCCLTGNDPPAADRIARTFVLEEGVVHAWLEITDPS